MHIDDAHIGLIVDQYTFEPTPEPPDEPTASITCSLDTLLAINTTELTVDQAIEAGTMTAEGDIDAIGNLFTSLSAPYIGAA